MIDGSADKNLPNQNKKGSGMMARPTKVGLDYFPHDCDTPIELELIEAEFGITGYAVIWKLKEIIYKGQGYYCKWSKDVALMFSKRNYLGVNVVSEIVSAAFRRNIFDKDMFTKYGILTSSEIQETYLEAVLKRKNINMISEYLLVDLSLFKVNVNINSINDNINSINSNKSTQSKVNKSKVNKSKEVLPSTNVDTSANFDYQSVINLFNSICVSLPEVKMLTNLRKKRIKDASKELNNGFETFFEKVEQSDFLSGRNGKWNRCSFDWILNPQNLIKIIEGNYDENYDEGDINKSKNKRNNTSYDIDAFKKLDMLDILAELKQAENR